MRENRTYGSVRGSSNLLQKLSTRPNVLLYLQSRNRIAEVPPTIITRGARDVSSFRAIRRHSWICQRAVRQGISTRH